MATYTFKDRVKDSSVTTGTGSFTLDNAPPTNFVAWSTTTGTVPYFAVHRTANEWEQGEGVVTGTTLTRVTVFAGTSGTSKVSFSAGTKDVHYGVPSSWLNKVESTVNLYTTLGDNTWTKPSGCNYVYVVCIGGGGGGGSGRSGGATTGRLGGIGGGGGGYSAGWFPAGLLSSTENVYVGAGGTGGTAISASNTSGNAGNNGALSTFGGSTGPALYYLSAAGGIGGIGGTNTAPLDGSAGGTGMSYDGAASSGKASANTFDAGLAAKWAGCSGGAGGSINGSNTSIAGGDGGYNSLINTSAYLTGGGGGAVGSAGGNGGSLGATVACGGMGGGGGGAGGAGAGGAGGNGGLYGAGGGGGGGRLNSAGAGSGAGGNGAQGCVLVVSVF